LSKKDKKGTQKKFKKTLICLCVAGSTLNCVSPDAVKSDIQGIKNDVGSLEKLVEQKADNSTVADEIGSVNNEINQLSQIAEDLSLWRKNVQAETINYGGAGWVVVGTAVISIIFLAAAFFVVRGFLKRGKWLALLTCAIQKVGDVSPESVDKIKQQLKSEVTGEGQFTDKHRHELGRFAKRIGTFAEQKKDKEV